MKNNYLLDVCENIRDTFGIPSFGAAFFSNGEYDSVYLGCDEDTLFAIGSCTKSFTAYALSLLSEKRFLSLDDRVKDYIKDFKLTDSEIENRLTIRDILSHRSGLAPCDLAWYKNHDDFSDSDLIKAVSLLPKSSELREKHLYNNMVYALSGMIIKECTGKDWKDVLREEIFEPLGIEKYAFSFSDAKKIGKVATPYVKDGGKILEVPHAFTGSISPAGSLYMTPNELLKWNVALLEKNVLSKNAINLMEEDLIDDEEGLPSKFKRKYGLGLQIENFNGEKLIYHGGAIDGFLANQSYLICKNCSSVMLTNLGGTFSREAFMHAINGYYLGDKTDWISIFKEEQKKSDEYLKIDFGKNEYSLCKEILGVYSNPLFGDMEVLYVEGALKVRIGIFKMPAKVVSNVLSFYHKEFGIIEADIVRDYKGDVLSILALVDPTIDKKFNFVKR